MQNCLQVALLHVIYNAYLVLQETRRSWQVERLGFEKDPEERGRFMCVGVSRVLGSGQGCLHNRTRWATRIMLV